MVNGQSWYPELDITFIFEINVELMLLLSAIYAHNLYVSGLLSHVLNFEIVVVI